MYCIWKRGQIPTVCKQRRQGEPVTAVSGKRGEGEGEGESSSCWVGSCECDARLRASGMPHCSPSNWTRGCGHGLAVACTVRRNPWATHRKHAGPAAPACARTKQKPTSGGRVSDLIGTSRATPTRGPMIDATAAGQPAGQWDLPLARSRPPASLAARAAFTSRSGELRPATGGDDDD